MVLDGSWRGDDDPAWQDALGMQGWRDVQVDSPYNKTLNAMPTEGMPQGTAVSLVYPKRNTAPDQAHSGAKNVVISDAVSHENLPRTSSEAYDAVRNELS